VFDERGGYDKRNDFIHKILTPPTASKKFSSKKIRVKNGLKRLKTPIQFGSPLCFRLDLKSENKHMHITGTHSKAPKCSVCAL
jgi:hypothetical protein